jgi:hypothetical protein
MTQYGNSSNPRPTIVVVEDPNRNFGHGPVYPTYLPWWPRSPWRSRPYWGGYSNRPYWRRPYPQWRPWYWRRPWYPDANVSFWDRLKLVVITVIATPVILVELAMLLDYLRFR